MFSFSRIKKARAEGKKCHAKTMMTTKDDRAPEYTHGCHGPPVKEEILKFFFSFLQKLEKGFMLKKKCS